MSPACDLAHRQCDNRRNDERNVDEDAEVLDLGHEPAGEDGADSVDDDEPCVGSVDNAVGRGPVPITGNRDACEDERG